MPLHGPEEESANHKGAELNRTADDKHFIKPLGLLELMGKAD
jgi:hypothetical protein